MPEPSPFKNGMPSWTDLATFDVSGAERFYAALFGWQATTQDLPEEGVYSIQSLRGKSVAAIYDMPEAIRKQGVPPHWAVYLFVDDVDATAKRVVPAGGIVWAEPFDVPGVGRVSMIQDPTGGFIRLWRPEPEHGFELVQEPGAFAWAELMTSDVSKAARFYEGLLGVTTETTEGPMPYTSIVVDGQMVAGILEITPEMGDIPCVWSLYIASDDVDAVATAAEHNSGTVQRAPFDIPSVGRVAVLADPQGAVFNVIKMAMPT